MMIDCHVHFSGSIPTQCVWDIIKAKQWRFLAGSYEEVRESIVYDGQHGFDGFLNKFRIFDEILWDEELLSISIKAVADEIIRQDLKFVWLDFSINKYLHTIRWHKRDLISFFHREFQKYAPGRVALVLSIKYESLEQSRHKYLELIDDPIIQECIAGIDLVGDEKFFDASFYRPYFEKWAAHKKMIRVHVGEVGRVDNVKQAIENLKITNIAHGIDIIQDEELIKRAIDLDIQFDLALTSNLKIRPSLGIEHHPIHTMINKGLKCTIGSDDPVVFATSLADEYELVSKPVQDSLKTNAERFTKSYGYL